MLRHKICSTLICMIKSIYILIFTFCICSFNGLAQGLDNPINNGGKIPSLPKKEQKTIAPLLKEKKKTDIKLYNPLEKPKPFSMEPNTNLRSVSEEAKKKVIQANKKIKNELEVKSAGIIHSTEQYLGSITVKSDLVNIQCRDYSLVDGDRVRIMVNGTMVANNIFITGSYKGIFVELEKGINEVSFIALNEGDASPNTAEFKVLNHSDKLVTIKRWALYKGAKATITVINE